MSSNSTAECGMTLSEELHLHFKESAVDEMPYLFLPQNVLDSIVTKDVILHAMGITEPTVENEGLVTYTLTKAKKVFATAAYINLQPKTLYRAMILFRNHDFTDEMLPLQEADEEIILGDPISDEVHPLLKLEAHGTLQHERIWTYQRIYDFLREQFKFIVPVFSFGKTNHRLANVIMRFAEENTEQPDDSFSKVFEIDGRRSNTLLGQNILPPRKVIVKAMKAPRGVEHPKAADHWYSEISALTQINMLHHAHALPLLTAFSRSCSGTPERYLIFDSADRGDLRDLWNSGHSPPLTGLLVKEAITQSRGLSDALQAIHEQATNGQEAIPNARHGDLKPDNIIECRIDGDFGKFKIHDVDESKSHGIEYRT